MTETTTGDRLVDAILAMLARPATEREREKKPAGYRVLIDDNFHYMDEDERYEYGMFGTTDEAIAACKWIVDRCLKSMMKPGMTAAALYELYVSFGEDPFVMAVDPTAARVKFSAWDNAKERCEVLTRNWPQHLVTDIPDLLH
jgi:hypothetical protein